MVEPAAPLATSGAPDTGGPRPDTGGPRPEITSAWPAKAADAVELVVDTIHDKAIRPVVLAGRALVFGLLILALGVLLAAVLSVGLVRLLDVYAFGHRVWASDALLGFVFTVAGLAAWSLRTKRTGAGGSH